MLKNYFKIAFRNLKRNKTYSIINILGLSIGIVACLLILFYVNNELSYDKYNRKSDQIYRVCSNVFMEGHNLNMATTPAALGKALVSDLPEVVKYTRLLPAADMLIKYKNKSFNEKRFLYADSSIFDVFTIPFIKGNPKTALTQPYTIVLTESTAKKYFGNEGPLNKVVSLENGARYKVTGIIKDCPSNSHFHYDMLAALTSLAASRNTNWLSNDFYTYIVLKKGASVPLLQSQMPLEVKKYVGPQLYKALGISFADWGKKGNFYHLALQPLTSIHLHSHLTFELEANSNAKYIYIFSIIAILILLIACINFMNLSTARSFIRFKEVGVRKTLGSKRMQLVTQFLIESFSLTFIAMLIAIALLELLLPSFGSLAGKHFHSLDLNNINSIAQLFIIALVVGIVAGIYPAFFLSSSQPLRILKGNTIGIKDKWSRNGLVIFQFSISIFLIIGTIIIYKQMKYVQNANLGFNKENVLVIQKAQSLENHYKTFKNEMLKYPGVLSASNSFGIPGKKFNETVFHLENAPASQQYLMSIFATGRDFAKTMKLKLVRGRYFSKDHPSDTAATVINQSAVKLFNLKDPLENRITFVGRKVTSKIIGVVKDFNFESLHQKIEPMIIYFSKGENAPYISVRVASKDIAGTISFIKDEWKKFAPGEPFEYYFLDKNLNRLYQSDQKTGEILLWFSVLAIFIACLGLFGLAAFTVERRTKEIGIRKVLGASVPGVIFLLTKEFTKWVLLANVIAWPIAYYLMHNWLKDFAYRINITWWVLALSGGIALVIALTTVSFHAVKAATANPVKSLRYE